MPAKNLLWLGCGDCEGLKYFNTKFDKMLLIDARSMDDLAIPDNLKCFYEQHVVSNEEYLATFKETNVPELSSLNSVSNFVTNFPGLRVEKEREVLTTNVIKIVNNFLSPNATSTLILDVPNNQTELLQSLLSEGSLTAFEEIIVWNVPLNKEACQPSKYLENNGFVSFSREETFNGILWNHFIHNPLFAENSALKKEIEKSKELEEKYESLKRTGIRLESQIGLIQRLMSFDSK